MATSIPQQPPQPATIIHALNACIETCMDGEKGFAVAAAEVRDPMLKELFMRRSKQRAENMMALQRAVTMFGGFPENEGTVRGTLHRSWMTTVRIAEGRSDALYLEECIRGERAAMRDYEAALHRAKIDTLPTDLSNLLMEQYRTVRESFAELVQIAADGRPRTNGHQVRTMEMPPESVVSMRTHTTLADLPKAMHATLETIARNIGNVGVPFAIYYNEPFRPNDIDVEMGVSLPPDVLLTKTDGLTHRQLPGGTIAYTLHVGPYQSITSAYETLFAWLRQNGHTPSGPPREVYLIGPGDTLRPEDYRTEIEIPFT